MIGHQFLIDLLDTWSTKDRIARYIRANEEKGKKYRLTIIHAEDNWDIPWYHTEIMFWHAVKASVPHEEMSYEHFLYMKPRLKVDLDAGGSVVEWRSGVWGHPRGDLEEWVAQALTSRDKIANACTFMPCPLLGNEM